MEGHKFTGFMKKQGFVGFMTPRPLYTVITFTRIVYRDLEANAQNKYFPDPVDISTVSKELNEI